MATIDSILEDRHKARMQVAFLLSQGLKQASIAKELSISQGMVSKLRLEAIDKGMLEELPQLHLPDGEIDAIRNERFLRRLGEHLADVGELLTRSEKYRPQDSDSKSLFRLPKIHVFHSSMELREKPDDDSDIWDKAVLDWSRLAAARVAELLSESLICGITWGRQCRSIVDRMMTTGVGHRRSPKHILPLWCPRLDEKFSENEKFFKDPAALSSNQLAADLFRAFSDGKERETEFAGFLPGFDLIPFKDAPKDFEQDLVKGKDNWEEEIRFLESIRKIYSASHAYQNIFGRGIEDSNALASKLDAVVASVGPAGSARSFSNPEKSYGNVPAAFFKDFTVGDIGGVLLPKEEFLKSQNPGWETKNRDCNAKIVRKFDRLQRRWMGPTEEHFRNCANRGSPGMIVLAVGKQRCEVVFESIRRGLVNHLVVDDVLATELDEYIICWAKKKHGIQLS